MKANIKVFSQNKLDVNCYIDHSENTYYHYSLEEIPLNLLKLNSSLKRISKDELLEILKNENLYNNFKEEELISCFGEDMIEYSFSLFQRFKENTPLELNKISDEILKNAPSEKISKEFHRLKSVFATFGLSYSRTLIEKKQKKDSIYNKSDIDEIIFSFNSDLIALDDFYKKGDFQ